MIDLYNLLQQIEEKPGLYIGAPSIRNLYMFLNGYQFARRQMKLPLSVQEQTFRTFQPWLQAQLNTQTTESWAQLILSQSGDDAQAFARFFSFFHQFLQEQRAVVQVNGRTSEAVSSAR